ncbi:MAG: TIM barrel protein [Chloroflexota bacterium]|jgi:inosose dehydratase
MAVTVDGDARARRRSADDALSQASIGTVPILWYNAGDDPGWDGATILDEIARLGYEGTQLGHDFPRGHALRDELAGRKLRLAEVYAAVPCTVDGPMDGGLEIARAGLRELHEARGDVLCVAVDGSTDRDLAGGRADAPGTASFSDAAWGALANMLHAIADEAAALGHPTVFHPHAGTYVETPAEIERLLAATDPDRVGVCLDTGHHIVAGADPVADLRRLGERVRHVHLKDVDPVVLEALRAGRYATLEDAVVDGLFTELGAGVLDLDGALETLAARDYDGWLMVEQDRSSGPPSEAAAIGRRVLAAALRRLGRDDAATGRAMRTVA